MSITNKITIIIVLYNSSEIIFECLKTLKNFEIIIVDNGKNSTVLKRLRSMNNIKIVYPGKNIGMGRGANFAFPYVKTDFFFIIES